MTKQTNDTRAAEIAAEADAALADAAAQEQAAADAKAKADADADAKAAAQEQAAADAKAKADADADAKAAAKSAKKAKAALASADELRAAIATVEGGNHALGRDALVAAMSDAGARFADRDNALHIDWLGIGMQTTAGMANALTAWCSKARRAILSGNAR